MAIKDHILKHLVDQFEQKRNDQLAKFFRLKNVATRETQTLNALEQFRVERLKQRRLRNGSVEVGVAVTQQTNESRFDTRLVDAIKSQDKKVTQTNEVTVERFVAMQEAQRRLTAINILMDRQARRARLQIDKADQKLSDERANHGRAQVNHQRKPR